MRDRHPSPLPRDTFAANAARLRVVHLNTLDHGGAANAALRLHLGLLRADVASTFLTLHARGVAEGVREVPTPGAPDGAAAWSAQAAAWRARMQEYPHRPPGREIFSLTGSDTPLEDHPDLESADVIHLHWVAGFADMARLTPLLAHKAVVWTLHDQNPFTGGCHYSGECNRFRERCGACPELGSSAPRDLSARQWSAKEQAYAGIRPRVVSPSRWLAGLARTSSLLGGHPVEVVPYGVPTEIFRPRDRATLRAARGLSPEDFVVLFGAHGHTQRKGFPHMQELLLRLPERMDGRPLTALSFGTLKHPLEGSAVPFRDAGPVADPDELAALYALADAYVLPTRMDNLPNTLLESLACGTPAVAFEVGGTPDCVRHGTNGWLCPVGSVDGLLEGLAWTAGQDARARAFIASDAATRYSLERQAGDYLRIYREVLGDG